MALSVIAIALALSCPSCISLSKTVLPKLLWSAVGEAQLLIWTATFVTTGGHWTTLRILSLNSTPRPLKTTSWCLPYRHVCPWEPHGKALPAPLTEKNSKYGAIFQGSRKHLFFLQKSSNSWRPWSAHFSTSFQSCIWLASSVVRRSTEDNFIGKRLNYALASGFPQ